MADNFGEFFTGLSGLGIWLAVVASIVGGNVIGLLHKIEGRLWAVQFALGELGEIRTVVADVREELVRVRIYTEELERFRDEAP